MKRLLTFVFLLVGLSALGATYPSTGWFGTNVQSQSTPAGVRLVLGLTNSFSSLFNILDFGAVGDGVRDNRTNIQNAANAAHAAGGGVVYVPRGSFGVRTNSSGVCLSLSNNVTVLGDGWESELLLLDARSVGISASGSSGSQSEQDAGNTNLAVLNLKIRYADTIPLAGIGVSLAGVSGGQIRNVWVDGCGGYSIYVGKNNATASTDGKRPDNVQVSECRVTGARDAGVEFDGAENCSLDNTTISGSTGSGIIVWNGAYKTRINGVNITGETSTNTLTAITIHPLLYTNETFRTTSNNTISDVFASNIKRAIQIGSGPDAFSQKYIWNTTIRDSQFYGRPPSGSAVSAAAVVNANGVKIENCIFDNYDGGFNVSVAGDVSNQESVTNLSIQGCQFMNMSQVEVNGVRNFSFQDNLMFNCPDSVGLLLSGVQQSIILNNQFSDIGASGTASGISLEQGSGSITNDCVNISVIGNKSDDSRATKFTGITLALEDGANYITAVGNNSAGGKAGAVDIANSASGTNMSLLSSSQLGGFFVKKGVIQLDNNFSLNALDLSGVGRRIILPGDDANLYISGIHPAGDTYFAPMYGVAAKVVFKSSGTAGFGTINPNAGLHIFSTVDPLFKLSSGTETNAFSVDVTGIMWGNSAGLTNGSPGLATNSATATDGMALVKRGNNLKLETIGAGAVFPLTVDTVVLTNGSGGNEKDLSFITNYNNQGYTALDFRTASSHAYLYTDNAGELRVNPGTKFGVDTDLVTGGDITSDGVIAGNSAYFTNDVSALTFTDRSRAPESLKDAYEIVQSMKSKSGHVDHGVLSPKAWGTRTRLVTNTAPRFVKGIRQPAPKLGTVVEPDSSRRDLGMVISAQAMVIQDLQRRLEMLEKKAK